MLKVSIIGCGGISRSHINGWTAVPEAKIISVCDIRPEKADDAAQRTGAAAYCDLDTMLAAGMPDILDICLPTYLHADTAVKALNMGIHVLTEKPISLNRDDVRRVYDAAAKNNRCFMVAQCLRFWPEFTFIKDAYEDGRFGKLLSGFMSRLGHTPMWSWDNWMQDKNRSGLVPFDLHIHDLDFMVYAFGKPKSVECSRAAAGIQDYLNAVYHYDSFFIATDASWFDAPYPFGAKFRFQFEKAVVEYKDGVLTCFHQDGTTETLTLTTATESNGINLPVSNAYYNEIRYFTDCVLAGKPCEKVKPDELETVLDCIAVLDSKR